VTNVSDTLTTSALGAAAGHTINFKTQSGLPDAGKIIVTFGGFGVPEGSIDSSCVSLKYNDSQVEFGDLMGSSSGKTVSLTVTGGHTAGDWILTIGAAAGIKNPATAGGCTVPVETRDFMNNVIDSAGSCTVTFTTNAGNTTVTGTVPTDISVSVPESVDMGQMMPGNTTTKDNLLTVTVDSNSNGWSLTVKDAKTSNTGYMTDDATPLSNPFEVKGGDQSTYTPLTSEVILEDSGDLGGGTIQVGCQQEVLTTDPAGDYSITLTFTAAVTI
jgi:hypothetical protein